MSVTSRNCHGTLTVIGNTVYFFVTSLIGYGASPRLSALEFLEYRDGARAGDLVRQTLTAYNVLGYIA